MQRHLYRMEAEMSEIKQILAGMQSKSDKNDE